MKWVYTEAGIRRSRAKEWICYTCGMYFPQAEQSFRCGRCKKRRCEMCMSEHRAALSNCEDL